MSEPSSCPCGGAVRIAILRDSHGFDVVATCERCGAKGKAHTQEAAVAKLEMASLEYAGEAVN